MPEKTKVLLASTENHIFKEVCAALSQNHDVIWVKEGGKYLKLLFKMLLY